MGGRGQTHPPHWHGHTVSVEGGFGCPAGERRGEGQERGVTRERKGYIFASMLMVPYIDSKLPYCTGGISGASDQVIPYPRLVQGHTGHHVCAHTQEVTITTTCTCMCVRTIMMGDPCSELSLLHQVNSEAVVPMPTTHYILVVGGQHKQA